MALRMPTVTPDLSIIIPVYDRTEYVNDAIRSVLGLAKNNKIEILIVSNIDLQNIVDYSLVTVIKTDVKSLSGKLELGVKASSADIIAFLEDDDLWCNNKISKIISIFKNNPDIAFYHNENIQFKGRINLNIVRTERMRTIVVNNRDLQVDTSNKTIRLLVRSNIGYNLSSMVVKKRLLTEHLNILTSLSVYGIDTMISIIALIYGKNVFIDYNIRTCVRIHRYNSYKALFNESYSHLNELTLSRKLISLSSEKGIYNYINLFYISTYVISYCKLRNIKRYKLFVNTLKYVIYSLKLGLIPQIYILASTFSRMINIKFYFNILEKFHG